LSNVIQFVLISGLAILLGAIIINLNVIDSKLNSLDKGVNFLYNYADLSTSQADIINLNVIASKLNSLDKGVNFLYNYADLSTSQADRSGVYPSGYYSKSKSLIALTNVNNETNKQTCELFLHELGHKNCFPDNSEECANTFKENNLYRCSDLQ